MIMSIIMAEEGEDFDTKRGVTDHFTMDLLRNEYRGCSWLLFAVLLIPTIQLHSMGFGFIHSSCIYFLYQGVRPTPELARSTIVSKIRDNLSWFQPIQRTAIRSPSTQETLLSTRSFVRLSSGIGY